MVIGYARVSILDQNLELQRDALERAGRERIFEDHVSGASTERPGWAQAATALREGDTLVVSRLDRLGRSLKHLIDTVNELHERGIGFKSLNENIDTTTAGGQLVFHIFGAPGRARARAHPRAHQRRRGRGARPRTQGRPAKKVNISPSGNR